MEYQTIIYEKEDFLATITLNRPEALNAVSNQLLEEFGHALDEVKADNNARVLIIKGNGRAFCAGWDLKEEAIEAADSVVGPEEWFRRFNKDWATFSKIWRLDKPVIAAVHGYCLGAALKIMLPCDMAIASEDALFGLPEVRHAQGVGLGQLIYSIGSLKKLKELMMLGDTVSAKEAMQIGLINEVVPNDKLDAAAHDMARRLALVPRAAIAMTKLYINNVIESMGLFQSVAYSQALSSLLTMSKDYQELEQTRAKMGPAKLKEFFKQRDAEFKRRL